MIHIAFICIFTLVVFFTCLYNVTRYKGHKRKKRMIYVGQCSVMVLLIYAVLIPTLLNNYAKGTSRVVHHSDSVQLNDLTTRPMELAEENVRVRLGRQESNGETYYLVNDPEFKPVKLPLESTTIRVRLNGRILIAKYTQVADTNLTEFLQVAGKVQSEKYQLYVAPGSVDLVTRPDTEPYPEYLKNFK